MVDFSKLASNNPENMVAGGLQDDFDGVVVRARYCPWDYQGKIDHHVLAVRLDIRVDGETETFDSFLSAGDLEQFMPSQDGEKPVDTEGFGTAGYDMAKADGFYAIRVGKKEGLSNNSNWAQFVGAAQDAGFPKDKISPDVRFLEKTHAHFNRVPQKKRSGLVKAVAADAANKSRAQDLLVITEFKGFVDVVGKQEAAVKTGGLRTSAATTTAPATTSGPASTGSPSANGLDDKLVPLVVAALAGAAEGLSKTKLPAIALGGLPAVDKGKGVKRIVESEFLSADGRPWAFDAESGTLYAV